MLQNGYVCGTVNRVQLFNVSIPQDTPAHGFVGLGTDSYGYADWDFIALRNASNPVGASGEPLYFDREWH